MECLFCKIIKGEIPSSRVYEDDDILVINDINPQAPVHVLIIPKRHFSSLIDTDETMHDLLGKTLFAAKLAAEKLQVAKSGYKIIINNGKGAGQLVFHLHLHLIGGWKKNPQQVKI